MNAGIRVVDCYKRRVQTISANTAILFSADAPLIRCATLNVITKGKYLRVLAHQFGLSCEDDPKDGYDGREPGESWRVGRTGKWGASLSKVCKKDLNSTVTVREIQQLPAEMAVIFFNRC